MKVSDVLGMITGFLGSLAGAGPWGIAAMALGVIAAFFGVQYSIGKWNRKIDARDQENAGADAGKTATELQNQVRDVANKLEDIGNKNPAVDPSKIIK